MIPAIDHREIAVYVDAVGGCDGRSRLAEVVVEEVEVVVATNTVLGLNVDVYC